MTTQETDISPIDSKTFDEAEAIAKQLFGGMMDMDAPIKGADEHDIVAGNIGEMLRDPTNMLTTVQEDGSVVGFSITVPIHKIDRTRQAEANDTAYVFFVGIKPTHQANGLVMGLLEDTVQSMKQQGYTYAECDCVLTNGWADGVERFYDQFDAIVDKYDHEKWPQEGPERFFRIDLSKLPSSAISEG